MNDVAVHSNIEKKELGFVDFMILLFSGLGFLFAFFATVGTLAQDRFLTALLFAELATILLLTLERIAIISSKNKHSKVYPVLWRFCRYYVSWIYRNGFKEEVPPWGAAIMTAVMILFFLQLYAGILFLMAAIFSIPF